MMTSEKFAEDYKQYFGKTVGLLIHSGCCWDEANELAQAAWARAWQCRAQWRGDAQFYSWVGSIAVNLHREAATSSNPLSRAIDVEKVRLVDGYRIENDLLRKEEVEKLGRWIASVRNSGERLALELRAAGLSGEEAAVVLGTSLNTQKTWLFRGLKRLRAKAAVAK